MRDQGAPLGEAMQDFLKEAYKLEQADGKATTTALAGRLGIAPSTATATAKKVAALGLARHEPYRGVRLTASGERVALEVLRHHRLLERYLAESLGLPLDAVHAEADRLEHHLSDELEARIDEALGFPTHDPHGDPIPTAELEVTHTPLRSLADLEPGEGAVVRRVPDGDAELLRYLASLALVPGERVELRAAAPFEGPLTVEAGGGESAISRELARRVGVE